MAEYFYTVDLGKIYGPKLERMAQDAGYDDFEEFAAMALREGLDLLEREGEKSLQAAEKIKTPDDPIPF